MITLNTSWKTSCSWLDRLAADARQGEPGLLRLDEDEWVTLADSDDLGVLADQGGHELQGMPGQGAARAARDGGGDGLGAFVVRAGAAEFPAAAHVEGLVEDLRRPRLANRGQVDRADCAGWMFWLMWKTLPGS